MMGLKEEQEIIEANNSMQNINNGGVVFDKVMTNEQLETLRHQIALYSSISQQLIVLHNNITSQQNLSGVRLGNFEYDPKVISASNAFRYQPRWRPTPTQREILQHKFDEENRNPSKLKMKELISELSQHGPISEKNIYNWYQNRRSRSKKKQCPKLAAPNNNNNAESSPKDEKTKPQEDFYFPNNDSDDLNFEDMFFESPDIGSSLYFPQLPSYNDLLSSTDRA